MTDEIERPFLSIVTRFYKRPRQLLRNLESVMLQTDPDYEQVLIGDLIGVGVPKASESFDRHKRRVRGRYVFLLDDDDFLIEPDFILHLKNIARVADPDVILFKTEHPLGQVLPEPAYWNKPPERKHICGSGFVVRREKWALHIHTMGGDYAGDFIFIKSLFDAGASTYWWDKLVTRTVAHNEGRPEDE